MKKTNHSWVFQRFFILENKDEFETARRLFKNCISMEIRYPRVILLPLGNFARPLTFQWIEFELQRGNSKEGQIKLINI